MIAKFIRQNNCDKRRFMK